MPAASAAGQTNLTPAAAPAPASTSPTPAPTPAPASTSHATTPAPAPAATATTPAPDSSPLDTPRAARPSPLPSSPLSPTARPFYPGESSTGRPKTVRWSDMDEDGLDLVDYELSPSPRLSYLEVARGHSPGATDALSSETPARAPPATAEPAPGERPRPRRRRPSRRARKRRPAPTRPAAQLQAVDDRPTNRPPDPSRPGAANPANQQRRRPRVDEDGFQEAMSRSTRRRLRQQEQAENRAAHNTRGRGIPPELLDRDCWRPRAPPLNVTGRPAPSGQNTAARTTTGDRRFIRTSSPSTPTASQAPSRTPSPSTVRRHASAPGGSREATGQQRFVRVDNSPTPPVSEAPSSTPSPPDSPAIDYSTAGSTGSRRTAAAEPERCYVDRSPAMVEEEARLRFALIAQVGNASRDFSAADISRAVAEATNLDADHFPVIPTFPESFLLMCSSQEARDRALGASPVPAAATFLSLRPWTRLVRADSTILYHKVGIEIDEIPEHAWDLDTASKLLAKHAWIEHLDPVTTAKTDMSTFKLTAWTKDPLSIQTSKTLCIAEPELRITYSSEDMQRIFGNLEPYLQQKTILEYPVSIHLRSIADFSPCTPSSSDSSPSEDGDSGSDGNPDRSYGFRRGVGPRLSGFPRRQGGINGDGGDAPAGGGNDAAQVGRGHCHKPVQEAPRSKAEEAAHTRQKNFPKVVSNTSQPTRDDADAPVSAATAAGDKDAVHARPAACSPAATGEPAALSAAKDKEASHARTAVGSLAATGEPAALSADRATICAVTFQEWTTHALDPMLIELGLAGPASGQRDEPPRPSTNGMKDPALVCSVPVCPPRVDAGHIAEREDPMLIDATAAPVTNADTAAVGGPATPGLNATVASLPRPEDQAKLGPASTDEDDGSPPGFSRAGPSKEGKLHAFTAQVQLKIRSPLAPRPAKTKRAAPTIPRQELPKRSSRLATHPLANVPSAKRAEVVLMRRFGMTPEPTAPNTEGKKAYDQLYKSGLLEHNFEAIRDLSPALQCVSPFLGTQA
ncbi:unnamed protein product [Urochloa decumbens]|uniref:Uncharacterized protein n=1 Tax=Urochloa decumbens TaxID=240449 RepID=A0ABC8Y594_9POAL